MTTDIRTAVVADRAELVRMRIALWPDSEEHEVDPLLSLPRSDGIVVVAAADETRLSGFAEFAVRKFADGCRTSPVAYLEGLWVDRSERRNAIATKLVRAGEAWARSQGLTELGSDCDILNQASQAFHITAGFEEVQRSVCYRRTLRGPKRDATRP